MMKIVNYLEFGIKIMNYFGFAKNSGKIYFFVLNWVITIHTWNYNMINWLFILFIWRKENLEDEFGGIPTVAARSVCGA